MSTSDDLAVTPPPADALAYPIPKESSPRRARLYSPPAFGTPRRGLGFLCLLCVLLVVAADQLFFAVPLGWTAGLFGLMLATAMLLRSETSLRSWAGRVTLLALFGLCLALVEHPGSLRICMALLAIASLAVLGRRGWTTSATAWIARWCESAGRVFVQLPMDLVTANRWARAHGGRAARSMRTAANWTIPILLSLVFLGLFALANPIISGWLARARDSLSTTFSNFFEVVSLGRVALWLAFGAASWSLLRGRLKWGVARRGIADTSITPVSILPRSIDVPSLLVRCLILFNLLFALQMGLDVLTLLTSGAVLPEGMEYRTYARRGAYPLVATALLAAAFVLISFPSGAAAQTATQQSNAMRWARRLVCLWIAQNIVLTISAMWRLWMYVEAFSLTRLRVAAAVWMLLVAIGLLAVIWRIIHHRTNAWLVRVNMVSLLAVLYACCFINVDSLIVWYDVKHCLESGKPDGPHLDRTYLGSLGPEAIEPFGWLASRATDRQFYGSLQTDMLALQQRLQSDLQAWQGWTWRRHRIAAAVSN